MAATVAIGLVAAACGTTDEASRATLPPIITTTSSTVPPTIAPQDGVRQFYKIKRGDTLAIIAASFDVTVQSIVELNDLENPDAIQAGQTIEIPTGVVLVDELPDPPASSQIDS